MNKVTLFKIGMVIIILLLAALGLSAQEYSLQLNGNGQYANCGSSPDFNFSNAFTVEAWIYPTDFKAEEHMNTIVAKTLWSSEFSHGWSFRYGSANRSLHLSTGRGEGISWIGCTADHVLTLNTWQHVAATWDGVDIKLYVNGILVATQNCPGIVVNAENNLCIGTINHSDMRYMTGRIDEVRIWNVVRTPFEIYNNINQNVTSPNLVAYYRMTSPSVSVLTDNSGNGHTAALIGSPNWITETPREYSLQLNGTSQYANCGVSTDFNFTNALTVEAWIYPTDFKGAMHMNTIVAKTYWNPNSYGWTFRYGSSSRTLNFNMSGGGTSWIDCIANNVLTLNTWQHVAATYDGTAIKLYVNGSLVATQNFSGNIVNTNNALCIGSINMSGDMRYMKGQIDEVRIWNVARAASEIVANLFQCETTNNLVAYYRMTNGKGTSLTDNSGHGHTGSLYNSPVWNNTNLYYSNPIVSTQATTNIGTYSATANGAIVFLGYPNPFQHGHCWNTGTIYYPTTNDSRTGLGPIGTTGAFSSQMTGLSPNTNYTVRAYVTKVAGSGTITLYGQPVSFYTASIPPNPPSTPSAKPASSITTSGFTANWSGYGFYSNVWNCFAGYSYCIDVSTNSDFSSLVSGYSNFVCGTHDASSNTTDHSYAITGLSADTTYFYRIRSASISYSPYSATIEVTTLANYNISYNTGNITGVRIYTAETDFGIDPPSPLVLLQGYSGTIQAEKDGYIWSLAEGSDSNIITNLSSNKNISFIGTYRFDDPANPGFVYQGEQDIPITVAEVALEDLSALLPPLDPGDAIVLIFSGTAESDITISVPSGTWYAIAYYDDPADGGLAWHHASPYPATGPQNIVFSNLPFGAKSEIPVIISSEDVTLPVELSSFTAIASANNIVTLSWVTQSETNLQGFVVLRSAVNTLNTASNISSLISATNTGQTTLYSFQDVETEAGFCYYYWLQIVNLDGSQSFQGPISVTTGDPGHNNPPAIPLETRLLPSYPNPFNPSTTIHYELKSPEKVRIAIYSYKGQLIDTYSQNHSTAGAYSWVFKGVDQGGRPLSSGIYFYTMTAGKYTSTNKMVLLK